MEQRLSYKFINKLDKWLILSTPVVPCVVNPILSLWLFYYESSDFFKYHFHLVIPFPPFVLAIIIFLFALPAYVMMYYFFIMVDVFIEDGCLRVIKQGGKELVIDKTDIIKIRRTFYMFYKIHYLEQSEKRKSWVVYYWGYNPPLTRQKELNLFLNSE